MLSYKFQPLGSGGNKVFSGCHVNSQDRGITQM